MAVSGGGRGGSTYPVGGCCHPGATFLLCEEGVGDERFTGWAVWGVPGAGWAGGRGCSSSGRVVLPPPGTTPISRSPSGAVPLSGSVPGPAPGGGAVAPAEGALLMAQSPAADGWLVACEGDSQIRALAADGTPAGAFDAAHWPVSTRSKHECSDASVPVWGQEPTLAQATAYYRDSDAAATRGVLTPADCGHIEYQAPTGPPRPST